MQQASFPFSAEAAVVITGAASGIGAALAMAMAARGLPLALVDLDAEGLRRTAQALRGTARVTQHVADLSSAEAVATLAAELPAAHPRIAVLVNNAGMALGGRFEQVSASDFELLMAVNFHAVVRLTRALLPVLAREPAAQLVNVSSIFGIIAPPGQTAYCASKFAVRGFSESLRHELAMAGSPVGVTLVHPGGVKTQIAERAAERARAAGSATPEELERERRAWRQLLKLSPEEAAARILRGIERREARVLVGRDASQAALLQRLFPVTYWRWAARDLARRTRQNPPGA